MMKNMEAEIAEGQFPHLHFSDPQFAEYFGPTIVIVILLQEL